MLFGQETAYLYHGMRLPFDERNVLALRVLEDGVSWHVIVRHDPIIDLSLRSDDSTVQNVRIE